MNNVHRQITLSILDAPYLKAHRVPVVYTAHDYILICPSYNHGQWPWQRYVTQCLDWSFQTCD